MKLHDITKGDIVTVTVTFETQPDRKVTVNVDRAGVFGGAPDIKGTDQDGGRVHIAADYSPPAVELKDGRTGRLVQVRQA